MQIKTAEPHEIAQLVEWAAREGWNPGKYDAEAYQTADPEGFFVGYLAGQMVASISAIKYTDWGFIGFYIVHPDHRGKGLGYQIWQHAIKYLQGCHMALDGVVEQQHNYQKSGFTLAHNNIRYHWQNTTVADVAAATDAKQLTQDQIESYLAPFFPAPRAEFNQGWRNQPNATAKAILKQDKVTAYGVIRACRDGYKIGPLFADHAAAADQLIDSLSQPVAAGANLYLDVPEPNKKALPLLEKRGAQEVFETARMYAGPMPDIQINQTYGITSFEIG